MSEPSFTEEQSTAQQLAATDQSSHETNDGSSKKNAPPEYTFPSPFDWTEREPVTLVELRMRALCGMIVAKPRWWEKITDDALVAKWRAEMIITDAQLDWVFAHLKWAASQVDTTTGIHATSVHGVYQSYSLIPTELRALLLSGVAVLEYIPDEQKD
ncbi:hypothetical protein C8Q76DRAFT_801702 [Earliella scabrosa]|nr:hypothetical protein C8Q76DRAFT_801702 [Earliella scabrosa]